MQLLVSSLPVLTFLLPASEWEDLYPSFEIERAATASGPFVPLTSENWQPAVFWIPLQPAYNIEDETLEFEAGGIAVKVTFTGTTPATVTSDIQAAAPWLVEAELTAGGIWIRTRQLGSAATLLSTGGSAAELLDLPAGSVAYGTEPYKPLVDGQTTYSFSDIHAQATDYYRVRYHGVVCSTYYGPFPALPNLAVTPSTLIEATVQLASLDGSPAQAHRVLVSFDGTLPGVQPSGVGVVHTRLQQQTDESGVANFRLIRGALVTLHVEGTAITRRVLVPSAGDSFNLLDSQYAYDQGDPWAVKRPANQPANIRGL